MYHYESPSQLVRRKEPSIFFHLCIFSCLVYVPIQPPHCTSMRPYWKVGMYAGCKTKSIIKYLEHMTRDLHTTWHIGYIFDEENLLALGWDRHPQERETIEWSTNKIESLGPHTSEFDKVTYTCGKWAAESTSTPRRLLNLLSPSIPRREGDLWVLGTMF